MDHRLEMSNLLKQKTDVENIYFAPVVKNNMIYPCIRYELSNRLSSNADDAKYIQHSAYTVMYITRNPSDSIPVCAALESIRYSEFVRVYVNDGLYHYVYTITI